MATIDDLTFVLGSSRIEYGVCAKDKTTISGTVEIPSVYNNFPVTFIYSRGFEGCTGITSVIIPSSVESIQDSAFEGCSSLVSVSIPNSVTQIDHYAFCDTGIFSIVIPSSVTNIGIGAFSACVNLESISVSSGNSVYHSEGNCCIETATGILISGCKYSIIPEYVKTIGKDSFYRCEGLVYISIPDSITCIDCDAFCGCNNLITVVIPSSVTKIGERAFFGCQSLRTFRLDGNAISESNDVFYSTNTDIFSEVRVKEGTTGWGDYWNGKTVVVESEIFDFSLSSDGTYYSVKAKDPSVISGDVVIPSKYNGLQVKALNTDELNGAFKNCSLIKSLFFNGLIKEVLAQDFLYCSNLEIVYLNGVETIGNTTFYAQENLKSVIFSESIKSIPLNSFWGCVNVEKITLPASMGECAGYISSAFRDSYKISNVSLIPTSSTQTLFLGVNCLVYNPLSKVVLGWGNPVFPEEGCRFINQYAFYGRVGVTDVVFTENIESIYSDAFSGCPNLKSVVVSSSIGTVGSSAFSNCPELSSFKFEGNCIQEGSYNRFENDVNLQYVCVNADANGWGDTWGGKPIYRVPDYGIKDKDTQIQTVVLGENIIPNVYLTKSFIHPYIKATGNISLRILIPSDNTTFQLFEKISVGAGGSIVVRWGDGEIYYSGEKSEATDFTSVKHVYSKAGEYVVKLNGNAFSLIGSTSSQWGNYNPVSNFYPYVNEILSLRFPDNSSGVSMDYAFSGCSNLTGKIPEWPKDVVSANFTYKDCTGLTCSIPEWGENIVNCLGTFIGDKNLTGEIPEWNSVITTPVWTYYQCKNLSGSIPAWTDIIVSGQETYVSCSGLTGSIPPWGASMTVALSTYSGCTGLYKCSTELITDPMPSRFTSFNHCVSGCSSNITKYFKITWGGDLAA